MKSKRGTGDSAKEFPIDPDDTLPRLKRGMLVRFLFPIEFGSFKEKVFMVLDGSSFRFLAGGEGGKPCKILSAIFRTTPFEIEEPTPVQPQETTASTNPWEQLDLF